MTVTGYLLGCAGCGGMFMRDVPRAAKFPGRVCPPDLNFDPWFCAKCAPSHPIERCPCGMRQRPDICTCELTDEATP